MKAHILQFLRDEEGATAIEYGIIAGLMAILLASIFADDGVVAETLKALFEKVQSEVGVSVGTGG